MINNQKKKFKKKILKFKLVMKLIYLKNYFQNQSLVNLQFFLKT
jgi:hypothetical protein